MTGSSELLTLWGVLCLDALDQFVKQALEARWYVRYCDDLVLRSADRGELVAWQTKIGGELRPRVELWRWLPPSEAET